MSSGQNKRNLSSDQSAGNTSLNLYEFNTHPFVVKIWLEETIEESGKAIWRGHITHIPSGEQRYLKELGDILVFIAPFLEEMGVKLGFCWYIRNWLKRTRI